MATAVRFIGRSPYVAVAAQDWLLPDLAGRRTILLLDRALDAEVIALQLNSATWPDGRPAWCERMRTILVHGRVRGRVLRGGAPPRCAVGALAVADTQLARKQLAKEANVGEGPLGRLTSPGHGPQNHGTADRPSTPRCSRPLVDHRSTGETARRCPRTGGTLAPFAAIVAPPAIVLALALAAPAAAVAQSPPVVSFVAREGLTEEARGSATAAVTLTTWNGQTSADTVTITWFTADGNARAPADYTASSGTLTFPAGTPSGTVQTISVPVSGDAVSEGLEMFEIGLSGPTGATLGVSTHTVTIRESPAADWIVPASPGFRVGPGADSIGGHPAIAHDGTNFMATFLAGSVPSVARITPQGVVLDPGGIAVGSNASAVPSIAFDGTRYLVVWVSGSDVRAARVTAEGAVDVAEHTIAGDAKPRPVTIGFDGTNFLAAWRTNGDAIQATRVTTAGDPLDGPNGFTVVGGGGQFYPWVAYGGGQYLVAWHAWGPNGLDVRGAFVNLDGTVGATSPFWIFTGTEDQDHVSVASNGTDFFVAWHDYRGGNDRNDGSTWGARVSTAGAVLDDPPLRLGEYARGQPPAVVVFDGTDYFVAWQQERAPADNRLTDSVGRRVSPAGVILDADPVALGTSQFHQWAPTLGYGAGRYMAAWVDRSIRCVEGAAGCSYGRIFEKAALPPGAAPMGPAGTAPGGRWKRESSPINAELHAVHALDAATAYAVGETATLLRWDGLAWSAWTSFPRGRMFDVWASGPDDVWVCGHCWSIAHWNGQSWSEGCTGPGASVDPWPTGYALSGSTATDLFSVGTLGWWQWYTGDPPSWSQTVTPTTADLWDVWRTSSDAFAVGEFGTVLGFTGASWSAISNIPTRNGLVAVWGSSANDVFVVGDAGTILHYDGTSWTRQWSGTVEDLRGVAGTSGTDVYAVGFGGTILRYDGVGWRAEPSGTTLALNDVAIADGRVWVVGDNGLILTPNTPTNCQSITVSENPTPLPSGRVNAVYTTTTFSQAGGIGATTLSLTGTLPTGLAFTPGTTGTLSGTPTQAGSFPIVASAIDSTTCRRDKRYTLVVTSSAGTGPVALAVNTAGNGVFDSAETGVTMAPSWFNNSGGPVGPIGPLALIGTLSSPSAGLSIGADTTGGYGTIADGATNPCSDCYTTMSNTGARPAQHWDATVTETPSTGSAKSWTLHIGGSFDDVAISNQFYSFIETIFHRGVTSGCSATSYCPANLTLRKQMARFLLRAKLGGSYTPPAPTGTIFGDVPANHPFAADIEDLSNRKVTSGCSAAPPLFCPDNSVTRRQMAPFLLRALEGPAFVPAACVSQPFADVPTNDAFCPHIQELAVRQITLGCGGGNYCPSSTVTRGQMAAFLQRTFGMLLYGPF